MKKKQNKLIEKNLRIYIEIILKYKKKDKKMRERACKTCHLITKNDSICPKCKTHTLSEDYNGEVIIIDPEESKIAEYLKIFIPGKYALRVR